MKKAAGFTLIELVMAMAVVLIALVMAVPNFRGLVQSNRLLSQSNDFIIAVQVARSEAIKRNITTILCPSANGIVCANVGWEAGWLLLTDNDSSGDQSAGDTTLKVFPALPGDTTIRGQAGTSYETSIIYNPTGFIAAQGQLVICDGRGLEPARAVVINPAGRPQLLRNSDIPTPPPPTTPQRFTDCLGSV